MDARNNKASAGGTPPALPFDRELLDALLERAGIDVLVVSSKHNIQYLIGYAYRFFFFAHFDAIGLSRYLPLLVYVRGKPEDAVYVGNPMENWERELGKFWMPEFVKAWGSQGAMASVVERLRKLHRENAVIGVERAFLPADAEGPPQNCLTRIVDATVAGAAPCEDAAGARLAPHRLERVVESMLATVAGHGPGTTKNEMVEALRREESRAASPSVLPDHGRNQPNRTPSDQVWREGDDVDPAALQGLYRRPLQQALPSDRRRAQDLLRDRRHQMAARADPGRRRGAAHRLGRRCFAIRPTATSSISLPTAWPDLARGAAPAARRSLSSDDADQPLEAGMVLSIETTLPHPRRGYIKIEDTVAVTETGWEAFGDGGRGWNRGGTGG
jgi:Xaa-Pro aminopeptidase